VERNLKMKMMKAIVRKKYGPSEVLELKEVEKPVPNDLRGVLVKVYASSVNPADRYDMLGPLMARIIGRSGLRRPKVPGLGSDVAGRVEAVAENVTQFKPGDEVFGVAMNGYAEYGLARENRIALKPANCSFEEAAAVPIAGLTALQALRDHGHIKSGQRVLINGAGGGVGTFAVQIAKSFGAEVAAVTNAGNIDLVRKLGADHVIDYAKEDFAKSGQRYDLICEIAASHSISEYKRLLNPGGRFVLVGVRGRLFSRLLYYLIGGRLSRGDKKFKFFIAKLNQEDLVFLKQLIEKGQVVPVIDSQYPLGETGQAIEHLGRGTARGKIVVTVTNDLAAPDRERLSIPA
jgi:NADPH:quinone reductase-like Zn-dependent oxidoreductase